MLLTILVPTYNRAAYLNGLLQQFSQSKMLRNLGDVELVVANNCSTDDTCAVLQQYATAFPNFRVIQHGVHVPTCEENIFRSLKYCRGEYTWILGDDDIPFFDRLPSVLAELRTGKHDFLLFNCPVIGHSGEVLASSIVRMHAEAYTTDIVEIAERFGFWYLLAGISQQILRTSRVRDFNYKPLTDISAVYSHVAAYLECFQGTRMTVFNYPLVWYKASHDMVGHWRRAAERMDVFDDFFWTLGFLRQLAYLIDRQVIPANTLFNLVEIDAFSRFRGIFVITEKLYAQVRRMRLKPSKRQQLSKCEFEEMAGTIAGADPLYREVIREIRALYQMPRGWWRLLTPLVNLRERRLMNQIQRELNLLRERAVKYLDSYYVHSVGKYRIYKINAHYWAAQQGHEDDLYAELRYVDARSKPPHVLDEVSLSLLSDKIRELENGEGEYAAAGKDDPALEQVRAIESLAKNVEEVLEAINELQRSVAVSNQSSVRKVIALPRRVARKFVNVYRRYQYL
jgi:glycosyltransferase involved in cell wall biosynthesis